MNERVEAHGLSIARPLYELVVNEIAPGTNVDPDGFWKDMAQIFSDLAPKNRMLLDKRDHLQTQIDDWHKKNTPENFDLQNYKSFLQEIDYLVPEGEAFRVSVKKPMMK